MDSSSTNWTGQLMRRTFATVALTGSQIYEATAQEPIVTPSQDPAITGKSDEATTIAHVTLPIKARIVLIGGGISGDTIEETMAEKNIDSPEKVPVETYDPKGMYRELVERFNLKGDKPIVVITSASEKFNESGGRDMKTMFRLLGVNNVHVIDTHDAAKLGKAGDEEANDYVKPLEQVAFVFVNGGNQKHMKKVFHGTKAEEILIDRCTNDRNFTYAGTSAGAMIPSARMPYRENSDSPDVVEAGFGILPFSVDTHNHRAGRFKRLEDQLRDEPGGNNIAISLPEAGAVEVFDGDVKIFGPSTSTVAANDRIKVFQRTQGNEGEPPVITSQDYLCTNGQCIVRDPLRYKLNLPAAVTGDVGTVPTGR